MVCIFFTPFFTAAYIVELLVLQTIYVVNKKIHQFLGIKIFSIIIESSFKSRAGYNGVRTVDKSVFEYQKMFKTKSPISPEVIREQSLFRNKKLSIPKWRLKIARY